MLTIDLEPCVLTFMEGDVVHAHFKEDRVGTVDDVKAMFAAIEQERKGRKALLMVSVGVGASLSNEARTMASSKDADHVIAADAIIVRDFGHQLSANAFVRYNRPGRPAQLFPDKESALAWLMSHHDLIDQP